MRRSCLILLGSVLITALTAAADSFNPPLLQPNEDSVRFLDVSPSFHAIYSRPHSRWHDSFPISGGALSDDSALLVNGRPGFSLGTGQGWMDADECRFCSRGSLKLSAVPADSSVPEPASLVLLAVGILGIGWQARTRNSA